MSVPPAAALELPATAALPQSRRFDHVRALFVQTPASLIGYLIGWSLMVAMYWPLAPRGPMLAWSGVLALLLLRAPGALPALSPQPRRRRGHAA